MNKRKIISTILVLLFTINGLFAQDVTTVNASNNEIGDHLDLEAVASIFGDSKDLEDFEQRLNDPETQISNLDLNEDNYVDYLRVVETAENNTHLIAIQAVLGDDIYQDVATLEVEKDTNGKTSVEVVGDVYMYGPNYIVRPVYVHRPLLFSIFWRPFYRPYKSVFYWGYYPRHFHFWHPHHVHVYRKNVHVHINVRHSYVRTHIRGSRTAVRLHKKTRRNDYGKKYPNRSYSARVTGVNKANGTKIRAAGVNKANGTKKRVGGVNKVDGTKVRVAGVNKADGTKKRALAVQKPNGNKKVVRTKNKFGTKQKAKKRKGKKGTKKGNSKSGKDKRKKRN